MTRLDFEQSVQRLKALSFIDAGETILLPLRMPHPDDEELAVRFFRYLIEDTDFSNLTLPRTFFGRSEFQRVSFAAADLSESYMCWNDFIDVVFAGADLRGTDMRASNWTNVSFKGANLSGADLRRSFFEACDFSGARMDGAVLTDTLELSSALSAEQLKAIAWAKEEGPEPEGG